MYTAEYEAKYLRRFYGKRRGRVVNNQDPKRLGRIKVECEELYGSTPSPWATPCFPFFGGRDSGFVSIPPVGSCVWVECEEGFVNNPIYSGGFFAEVTDGHNSDGSVYEESFEYQAEKSPMPAHSRGDYDGSDFSMKGRSEVPSSSFQGEYGKVTSFQTPGGHIIEMDDTDRGERVQIHHSKGSHIEILPDGTIHIIAEGNILTKSKNKRDLITESSTQTVNGDKTTTVEGRLTDTVTGDSTVTVGGSINIDSGSIDIASSGDITSQCGLLSMTALNLASIEAGGDMNLSSYGAFEVICGSEGLLSFTALTPLDKGLDIKVLGTVGESGLEVYSPSLPLPFQYIVNGKNMRLFLDTLLSALDAVAVGLSTNFTPPVIGGPNPPLTTAGATLTASIVTLRASLLSIQSSTVKASV